MYNPVTHVKRVVKKHELKIAYGAGIVSGVAGVVLMRKIVPIRVTAAISTETLQHLIDHTEDSLHYLNPKPYVVVELFNETLLQNK